MPKQVSPVGSVESAVDRAGLDTIVRSALYDSVISVLRDVSKPLLSSHSVSEAFVDVLSVFHEACSVVAEQWNATMGVQLPPEILAECLRAGDFETRVRASHVSRHWRSVALEDGQLWTSFRRRAYEKRTMDAALAQLSTMLRRSYPRPFRIHLPLGNAFPSIAIYKENIHRILCNDFWRIQEYRGPAHLFFLLNHDSTPMPHLTSFRFLPENKSRESNRFVLPADWGTTVAPNLTTLKVGILSLPEPCAPLLNLRTLLCTLSANTDDFKDLFICFPNLVSLELHGLGAATILPTRSFPSSLQELQLCTENEFPVDIGDVLDPWRGQCVANACIVGVEITPVLLRNFLSFSTGEMNMKVTRSKIKLAPFYAASDSWPYSIVLPPSDGPVSWPSALRGAPWDRLRALSVPIDHFSAFFSAQLDLPALVSLEFALNNVIDEHPRDFTTSAYHICVPGLQTLRLAVPSSPESLRRRRRSCFAVLHALRLGLRSLIRYDAPLLETIVVSGSAEVMGSLACGDLERFARTYTVISGDAESQSGHVHPS